MSTDPITPLLAASCVAIILCVVLLAAVLARAVTGKREMSISLKWLGLSLNIDATSGVQKQKEIS